MNRSKPPLRDQLRHAMTMRETTLRNGTCKRKDFVQIQVSLGRSKAFLNSYPFATDIQVRQWCLEHLEDVGRIVPGNQQMLHWRLVVQPLPNPSTQVA